MGRHRLRMENQDNDSDSDDEQPLLRRRNLGLMSMEDSGTRIRSLKNDKYISFIIPHAYF